MEPRGARATPATLSRYHAVRDATKVEGLHSTLHRPGESIGERAVELHLREIAQLFDSMDPCPFYERDLDPDAEEYIVSGVSELRDHALDAIVVHLDQPGGQSDQPQVVEHAIRRHFARKARLASRELQALVRRGWISLIIGLAFLAALLIGSEAVALSAWQEPFAGIVRESLAIGGWVAMWKPLEIFLYDWWPIVARRRLLHRLSEFSVRVQVAAS